MAQESQGFFFNVQKWRSSRAVQRMSFSERGVYLEMMFEQWDKRFLPDDPSGVADQIATTAAQVQEVLDAWATVRVKFIAAEKGPKRIYNAQLERTRRDQTANRRKRQIAGQHGGKANAAKRSEGKHLEASIATALLGSATAMPSEENRIEENRIEETRRDEEKEPRVFQSPGRDPFTDSTITERAGRFIERYQELYPKHRKGARYALKPVRDYAAAVTLCQTWTDDTRLDKLAVLFLVTDHRFAEEGSRTIPQFLALASWCDGKLAEWEAKSA